MRFVTDIFTDIAQKLDSRTLNRVKLAAMDSSASVLSSLLAFVVSFLSVSLTIGYLGEERFGVWMTVASIAAMLSFLDFGVGNGMVSQIAKSNVDNNRDALKNTATRGIIILCLIGTIVFLALSLLNYYIPVASLLNIQSIQAVRDAEELIHTFIIIFSINIPLNGIVKIMLGLQKGWMVHTLRTLSSITSLLLLYYLSSIEAQPTHLLVATYGIFTFAPLMLLPYLIKNSAFTLAPHSDRSNAIIEYKTLVNFGGLFLILQIGVMIGWGSDALLISSLASVSAVAQYAIVQRLFQFVSIPINILNNPLWGAYADAFAHGDTRFIERTLKFSLSGTLLLSSILSASVFFASEFILKIWISEDVMISKELILAFAIWKVLQSTGHSFSMALNGMHIVRLQVYSVLMLCALALPLKLFFTPLYGANAVVWSTIFAYTLSTVIFYIIMFRKHWLPRLMN